MLEEAGEQSQSNSRESKLFLDQMDMWLKEHQQQAIELFCQYDKIGNGILQPEEFKLGMRDLKIPCGEAQLHILSRLLDPNSTGTIDYMQLGVGLDHCRYRQSNTEEGGVDREGDEELVGSKETQTSLVMTKEELTRCSNCHLGLWSPVEIPETRYIYLELRIASFNHVKSHPSHIQHMVRSHMKVYGLIGQIRGWTGIASTRLDIYKDQSCSQDSLLPQELSLEECGYPGGPYHSPTSALLYYNYCIEFSDCPILNCDHYIRNL